MTILERARLWLAATPPAVEHNAGHNHTYYVANVLVHGWGLGANEALGLMRDWNLRCDPVWRPKELSRKVEEAVKNADKYQKPKGHMIEGRDSISFVSPISNVVLQRMPTTKPEEGSESSRAETLPPALEDGCRKLLRAAFLEGEGIAISEAVFTDDKEPRAIPAGQGLVLSREEWLSKLDAREGDPNRIWTCDGNPGAYIRINPMKVGGATDNDVTAYRHALLEFDGISLEEQWKVISHSQIPATAVVYSGGKSLHAWVRVDAKDRVEYSTRVTELLKSLEGYGPDPKNKNPSRFARLAGMKRGEGHQSLLALHVGAESWTVWKANQASTGTNEYRVKQLLDFDPTQDPNQVLGRRWLCKGHSCLIVGASGIGKSTLTMQLAVTWAVGRSPFGIKPKAALKMLVVQAENDIGDLSEQFRGAVMGHLPQDPDMARLLQENMVFVRDTVHTGRNFVERLQTLIDQHKPDMVWIDPLLSYIGDDIGEQRVASEFLRNWLGPLLESTGVVLMVVHHVRKPSQNDSKSAVDLQYLASGSSELVNWARAVVYLESPSEGTYRLRFLKRGSRAEAVDHEGKVSESIWVERGRNGLQTWSACPPPPPPEEKPKITVTLGKSPSSSSSKQRTPFDEDEYLASLSGEWHSYVDMVKSLQDRYGMGRDEAKAKWTSLKPKLSVKTPQQSGKEFNTYTYI
jgi:RecA-family ATPase